MYNIYEAFVNPGLVQITPRQGPRRKHSLYCWNVFTEPLHSNGRGEDLHRKQSLYCWGLFTDPLLSNVYTRDIINVALIL
jgi:hypothetical protein